MTKQTILAELKSNGNETRFQQTPTWSKAFDLYNASFPNDKVNTRCGSCYRKVLKWLQS